MRRKAAIVVALVGLVLAAAIGAAGSPAASERATATNLTIWVGWSARELNEFKKVVAEYDAKNADVTVKVVGSINDDKITAALRSGNVPDVVSSFTSQNVGVYCPSGGWIDLAPYLKRDKINTSIFPATTRYYTQYGGTRCALPLLADAYGFYYNKQLFKKAGLTRPPRTLEELDRVREEAHDPQGRRIARRRRLRPVHRLLPELDRRLPAARRGEVLRRGGEVVARRRTPPGSGSCAGRRTSSTTTATTSSSSGRRAPVTSGPPRTRSGAASSR